MTGVARLSEATGMTPICQAGKSGMSPSNVRFWCRV